jgi:hypothetical protein
VRDLTTKPLPSRQVSIPDKLVVQRISEKASVEVSKHIKKITYRILYPFYINL